MGTICKKILNLVLTIGSYKQVLPLLYIGQILMGFGGYSLSMVSYSYLSEISNDIWRQKSLVLTYSFWYNMFNLGLSVKLRYIQLLFGLKIGKQFVFGCL